MAFFLESFLEIDAHLKDYNGINAPLNTQTRNEDFQ